MKKENRQEDLDRHLDVPAEANRDKHQNYLAGDDEEKNNNPTERQKQWQEGLEEGRKIRDNQ